MTDSSVVGHADHAMEALTRLWAYGFCVSVDDFGTGYSSLAYLKDLPACELKIDQSFVTGLAIEPGNQALVKAVVALAHEFDMKVVAEGVESVEEMQLLGKFGCDIAQGYYISKPLDGDALIQWYRTWKAQ